MDTIRMMHYNMLMFPDANMLKGHNMKPISRFVKPDIITCNEMIGTQAIDTMLAQGLDTSIYSSAPYIWDVSIGNGLFYNKHKIGYLKYNYISTSPRRTSIYYLYYKDQDFSAFPDTVFLTLYVVHLKSSQGSANEIQRATQTAAIRTYLLNRPAVFNTFLNGDFNTYSSSEVCYQNLLAEGVGQFFDPINRPGSWSNNSTFKDIHTQSPRTTSFDDGVTGGLDDRFDFILSTEDVINGTHGLRILPETYKAFGNDGNHFNLSIISSPINTSAPDSVIQALHQLSDHLPVVVDVEVDPANAYNSIPLNQNTNQCLDWKSNFSNLLEAEDWTLTDFTGRIICQKSTYHGQEIIAGLYVLYLKQIGGKSCYQKISVR